MPEVNEAAILNPNEFMPKAVELDLDSIGLAVRADGVDWGESTIEAQMVKQAQGESSAYGRRGGVAIKIPIRVQEEGDVPLAVAAHKLDAIVAGWQEEGGWVRRDFDDAAGFSGSLGYRIVRHTAALSGLQGWLFAHNRIVPDVFLTATRWPIGYDPEKRFTEWFDLDGREVIWEEEMGGTAPGLIYINFENENETEHLRGARAAIECRDHPQDETADTTARLSYAAAELTLSGGSTIVEDEGVEVVENDELTAGWITVFSSEIDGVGHMTHAGPRRPWLRAKDMGEAIGGAEYRMLWRALGAPRWKKDPEVLRIPSRVPGEWEEHDMGEARPQLPEVGEARWEFAIQARAPSGSGAARFHLIRPEPTEQNVLVRSSTSPQEPDSQSTKSPGTMSGEGEGLVTGPPWLSPDNAKVNDGSLATVELDAPLGAEGSDNLTATNHKFAIDEDASILGVLGAVRCSVEGGSAPRGVTSSASLVTKEDDGFSVHNLTPLTGDELYLTFGGPTDSWGMELTPLIVNDKDFGWAFSVYADLPNNLVVGVNHMQLGVYYTEASDPNRVCFAGRSIDLRTTGIYRQGEADDAWGRLVEEGSLPYSPPARLEKRTARGIFVPSQGDFGLVSDEGINAGRARVAYQPGYLFAREAAS